MIAFLLLLALELGSFANACIYRWPRQMSVSWPRRSFCPWCKTQIAWYQNLPLFSYLFLKGRCASCQCPISIMYPLNEAITPLLMLLFLWAGSFQMGIFSLGLLWFSTVLVITTQVDIEWKIVPDQASFSLMVVGIVTSFDNPALGSELLWNEKLLTSLIGLMTGGGLLLLISLVGEKILGKEVMGLGDVKLLAAYGALLGWRGAIAAFIIGSILASILSIYFLLTKTFKQNRYIPFAPFLNAGAAIAMVLLLRNQSNISINILGNGLSMFFF